MYVLNTVHTYARGGLTRPLETSSRGHICLFAETNLGGLVRSGTDPRTGGRENHKFGIYLFCTNDDSLRNHLHVGWLAASNRYNKMVKFIRIRIPATLALFRCYIYYRPDQYSKRIAAGRTWRGGRGPGYERQDP